MNEFHTYIFKEGRAKKKRNRREKIIGFAILIAVPVALYFGFPVMGMIPLLVFGYIAYRIIKAFNKTLGLQKFGSKQAELIIAEDYLQFHDQKYFFSEMNDFTIYVDEFTGKSKFPIGKHHGGNNEIRFSYKDQNYSFNYLIESPNQFRKVEKLVQKIESKFQKN